MSAVFVWPYFQMFGEFYLEAFELAEVHTQLAHTHTHTTHTHTHSHNSHTHTHTHAYKQLTQQTHSNNSHAYKCQLLIPSFYPFPTEQFLHW